MGQNGKLKQDHRFCSCFPFYQFAWPILRFPLQQKRHPSVKFPRMLTWVDELSPGARPACKVSCCPMHLLEISSFHGKCLRPPSSCVRHVWFFCFLLRPHHHFTYISRFLRFSTSPNHSKGLNRHCHPSPAKAVHSRKALTKTSRRMINTAGIASTAGGAGGVETWPPRWAVGSRTKTSRRSVLGFLGYPLFLTHSQMSWKIWKMECKIRYFQISGQKDQGLQELLRKVSNVKVDRWSDTRNHDLGNNLRPPKPFNSKDSPYPNPKEDVPRRHSRTQPQRCTTLHLPCRTAAEQAKSLSATGSKNFPKAEFTSHVLTGISLGGEVVTLYGIQEEVKSPGAYS